MNSNVKKALMVGGVVIVGYFLWKKYGKKVGLPSLSKGSGTSNFVADEDIFHNTAFNDFSGRTGRRASSGDDIPNCPSCSSSGECYTIVPRTDATIQAGIAGQRAIQSCTPPTSSSTTLASRRR